MKTMLKYNKKVLIAMSGGTDSSAAAFLLKKKGYDVSGIYMRLGDEYQDSEQDARRVCDKLGIKLYPVNISSKFKDQVVSYFIESYQKGETPNPCVRCNKLIKFGELLKWREKLGMDYLATGHYIQNIYNKKTKEFELFKASDKTKDQSYFLYNLGQKELGTILFPLGKLYKKNLKELVKKEKLPIQKKESMDICFLHKNGEAISQNEYLKNIIKLKSGPIKLIKSADKDGIRKTDTIGEHKGLPLYTIGQRRGVEIGGTGPFYVAAMSYPQNTLYVVNDFNDELLMSESLDSIDNNFVSSIDLSFPLNCQAVIRYRHKASGAMLKQKKIDKRLIKTKTSQKNETLTTSFKEKQRAITVGQSVVWYEGEKLLGGGVISGSSISDIIDFVV